MKRLPIRHIGYHALCDAKHRDDNIHRIDLGVVRYRQLGVRERFKDEKPYRVCKRCIKNVPGEYLARAFAKAFKRKRRVDRTAKEAK